MRPLEYFPTDLLLTELQMRNVGVLPELLSLEDLLKQLRERYPSLLLVMKIPIAAGGQVFLHQSGVSPVDALGMLEYAKHLVLSGLPNPVQGASYPDAERPAS